MVADPLDPLDCGDAREHEGGTHGADGELGTLARQALPEQEDQHERRRRQQGNDPGVAQHGGSALQLVDAIEVRTPEVAVDQEHDRQADPHLGGGDRDDEEREDLSRDLLRERGERDQVDVDGVEHQLDREQDQDAIAAGEHAVDAAAEEECAEDEVLVQRHSQSLRAMTTAPTSAASSSIETTSNGTTKLRKIESATGPVRLTRNSSSESLMLSCPNAFTRSAMSTPNRKTATMAAGQRWSLSKLPAVIGARVSMMPKRKSTAMAPM